MDLLSGASELRPLIAHPKAVCHFWDGPTCLETTEFPTGMLDFLAQSSAEADTLLQTLPALCPSHVAPRTMKTPHFFLLLPLLIFPRLAPTHHQHS